MLYYYKKLFVYPLDTSNTKVVLYIKFPKNNFFYLHLDHNGDILAKTCGYRVYSCASKIIRSFLHIKVGGIKWSDIYKTLYKKLGPGKYNVRLSK